jgi:acetylornithine deacetylase/succinyl-diaminopimelate desuccinylase-like protein
MADLATPTTASAQARSLLAQATDAWSDEALGHLQRLVRMRTVNPPGDEAQAIEYVAGVLRAAGLEPRIFEVAPGRSNLVCRIAGRGPGGPLLLASHADVVEAEAESWRHDPFGGEIADGCLWGRGTIDMKGKTAMDLAAMLAFARSGVRPRRDVTLLVVADEEAGCTLGSRWMVENHPDLVAAEVCLNEVGGFTMHLLGVRYYPVQVAEKGVCWMKLTFRGAPGHGSLPRSDSAPVKLATAVAKLGTTRLPIHLSAESMRFVEALAANQPAPVALALRGLKQPLLAASVLDFGVRDAGQRSGLDAILRNTVSPTVLRAGNKTNVIPGIATVELDGRTVPGQTSASLVREIRAVVGDDFEVEILEDLDPVATSCDTPEYRVLCDVLRRHDPTGVPVPWLIPGFTDAKFYARLGTKCYGFMPLMLPEGMSFTTMFHGHDERVPVDGYRWGLRVHLDAVARLALDLEGDVA